MSQAKIIKALGIDEEDRMVVDEATFKHIMQLKGLTLEEVKNEVRHADPELQENDVTFSVAVVLISAAYAVGPEIGALVLFTGYSEAFISGISRRMQAPELWTETRVENKHWFKNNTWTPGIWLDCLVAQGLARARCRAYSNVMNSDDRVWEYGLMDEKGFQ